MQLNDYQEFTLKTYKNSPGAGCNIIYLGLKLSGEVGEVNEKIGKHWRNNLLNEDSATKNIRNDNELKTAIKKELGDCLWYIARMADDIGVSLEEVAQGNIDKINDRLSRGVIRSEGDDR